MKKRLVLGLALVAVLSLGGCMFLIGNVWGAYSSDGDIDYLGLSGFPSGTISEYTYYETGEGTFDVYYRTFYSGLYYPGDAFGNGGASRSYYWHYTYTVSGTFLADSYYWLYLNHDGLWVDGVDSYAARSLVAPAEKLGQGSRTFKKEGLTITVTGEIVQLTPEEEAKLPVATIIKK